MEEFYEDSYNEYNDPDAMDCIDDYNTFEENQVFLDNEGYDRYLDSIYEDRYEYEYYERDYMD